MLILLKKLWSHITIRRKRQFGLLLLLILVASVTEVVSIGAIIPLLGILTAPAEIFKYYGIGDLLKKMGLVSPTDLLLPISIFFAVSALIAGFIRLLLLWISTKLSYSIGADISMDIYRRTLFQPYIIHISRNSSEVVSGILSKANSVAGGILNPFLTLISSFLLIFSVLTAIITIEPFISMLVFSAFAFLYILTALIAKKKLLKNGVVSSREQSKIIRVLQEGLGGIREILLDGNQQAYCEIYKESDYPLRQVSISNIVLWSSPRYVLESFALIMMAVFVYVLGQRSEAGLISIVPVLGSMALGAQRVLPVLQQAYTAWSNLQYSKAGLIEVLSFLDQPLPPYSSLPKPPRLSFERKIEIRNLSFRYSEDSPTVLDKVDLDILKGSRVGFIGVTGSGKSTLLDLIMYLLEPSEGTIKVDGCLINSETMRSWQANIAHVPQSIYLSDSTITENIAFGLPKEKIDMEKVRKAAKQAQIADHIEGLTEGYNTYVGERGIRLSGGQRQRIGIARALYKEASVIIFDEATSSLDNDTEKAVMQAIDGLGKDLTILMIAHRLSTIQNCDKIVEFRQGKIVREVKPQLA